MSRREMREKYCRGIPHCVALNMGTDQPDGAEARMRLPYSEWLIGDPVRGLLSTGPITALIDSVCGMAVYEALDAPRPIATVDLRVDYLRPAVVGADVVACAECIQLTRRIAFVRAWAWQNDRGRPVASAQGAFMHGTTRRGFLESVPS